MKRDRFDSSPMANACAAIVVAILLALALLHWATPCAEGTLC